MVCRLCGLLGLLMPLFAVLRWPTFKFGLFKAQFRFRCSFVTSKGQKVAYHSFLVWYIPRVALFNNTK
jgi:hypothetical protein